MANATIPAVPGRKILFVDDEEQIRKLLSTFLTRRGYQVATAIDGQAALAAFESDPPDLLITDINMPNMDGVELSRRLRSQSANATLPILLLSAQKASPEVLAACVEVRADFMPKPIVMGELATRVAALLS